eukprot:5374888-Pleurochrysis_carterae.AAC.6
MRSAFACCRRVGVVAASMILSVATCWPCASENVCTVKRREVESTRKVEDLCNGSSKQCVLVLSNSKAAGARWVLPRLSDRVRRRAAGSDAARRAARDPHS